MDWSNYLESQGRGNDSLVAHITPQEALLLKRMGGSGTRNPQTGLLEFWDDGGNDPGGEGGETGSTGYGGGGEEGRGGPGDDPAAGNYGGWGNPGSAFEGSEVEGLGLSTIGIDQPGFFSGVWDTIGNWFEQTSLFDMAMMGLKAVPTAMALATNPVTGLLGLAKMGFSMAGVPTSLAAAPMALGKQVGKDVYGSLFGTEAQKAAGVAANTEAFNTENQNAIEGKEKNAEWGGGWEPTAMSYGDQLASNEKDLDRLFKEYGETGDFSGALNAAKQFEQKANIKAQLESAINRYSDDPDYQAIEPELRVMADAAQEKGMEPKVAAEYAFEKVKEAYRARKFIKDFLDRKRKELSEATA